jgi:hypothetical protein
MARHCLAGLTLLLGGCSALLGVDLDGAHLAVSDAGTTVDAPSAAASGSDSGADASPEEQPACGPCSLPHATATCSSGGACAVAGCDAGWGDCDGLASDGCEADLTSGHDHCGSCSTACAGTQVCNQGSCTTGGCGSLTDCNGSCVDTSTAVSDCGSCGHACVAPAGATPSCGAGSCSFACNPGYQSCGTGCCPIVPVTYNDVADASRWSFYDTSSLSPGQNAFAGAAFDGRYFYMVPTFNGITAGSVAIRCDTSGAFTAASSWSAFDLKSVPGGASSFQGAAFDGRYVYLVPDSTGSGPNGVAMRFDTQGASFTAPASWSVFDLTTAMPGAGSFHGAAFDGRYVYVEPFFQVNGQYPVVRYDPQGGGFTAPASWASYDDATGGFAGSAFDGRFVYLVPWFGGVVTRYDTQGAGFTSVAAWSSFDLSANVSPAAAGFLGAAFDGRYVYLVPNDDILPDGGGLSGVVARYDTQAGAFAAPASWATFDVSSAIANAHGFAGAAFDGRYVYLVPEQAGGFPGSTTAVWSGLVVRYDTQAAFASATSWSAFDLGAVDAGAKGFRGAVFDGRYVYLIPYQDGVVARFDAKSPPSMPPGYSGSFY